LIFYRLAYLFLKSLVVLLKPVLPPDLKNWVELRQKNIGPAKDVSGSYWFHASSGELEYCKPLIRKLKEAYPQEKIVVTYSSPSAEKLFGNVSGFVEEFVPVCWDQPSQLSEFFEKIKPKALLVSRTDLWPEMVYQAKIRAVPLGLFSFNPKFNFVTKFLYRRLLPAFSFISCVDEFGAEQLKETVPSVKVTSDGDTRFDQVFFRLSQESKIVLSKNSKLVVFGSTWPQDETVVLNTFAVLKQRGFKIVLSPHDVNEFNINRLKSELQKREFTSQLLSDSLRAGAYEVQITADILLIDKIGYLADGYRYADFAFVGGSFKDKVHSIMEPLCCGLKVAVGPLYKNSPEGIKYFDRFVFAAKSTEEMLQVFDKISTPDKEAVTYAMKKNLNASQKVLDLILNSSSKKDELNSSKKGELNSSTKT